MGKHSDSMFYSRVHKSNPKPIQFLLTSPTHSCGPCSLRAHVVISFPRYNPHIVSISMVRNRRTECARNVEGISSMERKYNERKAEGVYDLASQDLGFSERNGFDRNSAL